jgi:hypothetical protein
VIWPETSSSVGGTLELLMITVLHFLVLQRADELCCQMSLESADGLLHVGCDRLAGGLQQFPSLQDVATSAGEPMATCCLMHLPDAVLLQQLLLLAVQDQQSCMPSASPVAPVEGASVEVD